MKGIGFYAVYVCINLDTVYPEGVFTLAKTILSVYYICNRIKIRKKRMYSKNKRNLSDEYHAVKRIISKNMGGKAYGKNSSLDTSCYCRESNICTNGRSRY